jgi:hypothetical protein
MKQQRRRLALFAVSCVAIGSLTAFADSSGGQASASTTEVLSASTSDYVDTPAGSFHSSCVHAVADGDVAQETPCAYPGHFSAPAVAPLAPTAVDAAPDAVQSPIFDGWMVAGAGWASSYVRYFHADFWVPRNPTVFNDQLVYLFPGLEDATGSSIFQPVLQYGVHRTAGGGNYWSIGSWVVTNSGAWHSTLERAYAGDHLYGSIFASNCSSNVCDWTVWTDNVTRGWSTTLKIRSGYQLKWVVGEALEVHRLETCSGLPSSYSIAKNIFL